MNQLTNIICWEIQIIFYVLIILQKSTNISTCHLHNYVYIIDNMITYNLWKIINCKHRLPSGSQTVVSGFIVMLSFNLCTTWIVHINSCLQNNILVMLIVHNFIPIIGKLYRDCRVFKVWEPLVYMYSTGGCLGRLGRRFDKPWNIILILNYLVAALLQPAENQAPTLPAPSLEFPHHRHCLHLHEL